MQLKFVDVNASKELGLQKIDLAADKGWSWID